nr:lysine-rich arabinogalactan protein 18-like [Ipomoea batatas]GMD18054.1 lysine-rich arabinogalactan protein 18-like [Ipomoea batatas]
MLKKKSKKHTASSPPLSPELLGPPVPPNEALGPNADRFSPAHELNDKIIWQQIVDGCLREDDFEPNNGAVKNLRVLQKLFQVVLVDFLDFVVGMDAYFSQAYSFLIH